MSEPWYIKARLRLKARGVRYIDLAAALGCTEGAVGHYLNGRREPSVEQAKIIAQYAGMSLSEMVGEDPRFINDEAEKQLIDIFRTMTAEEKVGLLAVMRHTTRK